MTPTELSRQEEHLFAVLSGKRFLQMEGLSNEVPFFIYPYDPGGRPRGRGVQEADQEPARQQGHRGPRDQPLRPVGRDPQGARGLGSRARHSSPSRTRTTSARCSRGCSTRSSTSRPAIRAKLAEGDFDIFFLTGIGEVFPYIRSHNVLNNLQSVVTGKPMLMFFPGRYEQSDTLGSSLVLFGRLKDDQYYRAKNILEQEA